MIVDSAHLTSSVGGLERTNGSSTIIGVQGQSFAKALQVTTRKRSAETNETQMTIPNAIAVKVGDTCLAEFYVRSATPKAQLQMLFEKATSPWTKSVTFNASSPVMRWRRFLVPFAAAETYSPGEAMLSLRFAFGPQTIAIGGLKVLDYGKTRSLESLVELATASQRIDGTTIVVNRNDRRQTMIGMGGDFCQPRYGSTSAMDTVGQYNLDHLNVVHARIGFPLNNWNPEPNVYKEDAQAKAALEQLQVMKRKSIPTVLTIWEGPKWMLGGEPEQSGRVLPPERYQACINAIAQFLEVARDKYNAEPEYFSFNEADYGVNFKFGSKEIGDFMRLAGPEFERRKIKTKFLIGDTANATNLSAYVQPLLQDESIAKYLGPISFHCWDVLEAPEGTYSGIAELGRKFRKPVWCLEAGHDAGLWQHPDPWKPWDNGLRTALAYAKTVRLSGAELMDYWTYQDNYPLLDEKTGEPYPVWQVIKQMESVFAKGATVLGTTCDSDDIQCVATISKTGRLVVLIANPCGAGKITLKGLKPKGNLSLIVSDKTKQRRSGPVVKTNQAGTAIIEVPARSVITVSEG